MDSSDSSLPSQPFQAEETSQQLYKIALELVKARRESGKKVNYSSMQSATFYT